MNEFACPKRVLPPVKSVNFEIEKIGAGESSMREVRDLSQKLVEKCFLAPNNFYQMFKDFDTDGDGYVSYQDFADKVE